MPSNHALWVDATKAADLNWKDALAYAARERAARWEIGYDESPVKAFLERARAEYRRAILSAWWALGAPLRPGRTVPNAVAECLAEEWDLLGRSAA